MGATLTNYDGSIKTTPQQIAHPKTVAELQAILKDTATYPSPVRAMGSHHSLTPCAASTGTVIDMKGLNKVSKIDAAAGTFTAGAGLEMIEANRILREKRLQLLLNIEIGNLTLGSAACCHTKDSLDAVEFGQVSSYITAIKWVTPTGDLREVSETSDPKLMGLMRSSYGLAGVIYEVTIRIKPIEIVRFNYEIIPTAELTQAKIDDTIAHNQCLVCWTIGHTTVLQTRNAAATLERDWLAGSRQFGWNFLGAFLARAVSQIRPEGPDAAPLDEAGAAIELGFYRLIQGLGGFTLEDPDKMIDYSHSPPKARYAFTFWAFPRKDWVKNVQGYLDFADAHFAQTGFRCNMPLGAYFVRKDRGSLLSYTHDGDAFSLDPIHAPSARDQEAWNRFLDAFNTWASPRQGIPLLNQSPRVTKAQAVAAYGARWTEFSQWVKTVDPQARMVNEFFAGLLA
jgi:FAD/FMN-containing dehydrogenase